MERSDIPRDEGVPSGSACQRHGPKDLGGDEGDIHHFGVQASVYLCSTTMRLRRSIAILLLGVFLSNTMEAHQFLKLPALFEHLSEHQADSPTRVNMRTGNITTVTYPSNPTIIVLTRPFRHASPMPLPRAWSSLMHWTLVCPRWTNAC